VGFYFKGTILTLLFYIRVLRKQVLQFCQGNQTALGQCLSLEMKRMALLENLEELVSFFPVSQTLLRNLKRL
jgi:hypothetical protein